MPHPLTNLAHGTNWLKKQLNPYAAGGSFGIYKMMQKSEKYDLKPWHIDTHLRVLSKSYPMNTNIAELRWFMNSLHPCALDGSSLTIRIQIHSFFFAYLC